MCTWKLELGYKCNELTVQDYTKFHRHSYGSSNKIAQVTFFLKYCTAQTPKKMVRKRLKQYVILYQSTKQLLVNAPSN